MVERFIQTKLGKQTQTYPPYSSKTFNGKPLHWWARNNKLSEITIPQRQIIISEFKLLNQNTQTTEQVKQIIFKQIDSVRGDFRQKEIKTRWEEFFVAT